MTARGNERKAIFRTEADRRHFLALLGTLAERFGVLVHAYVLMDNHFHLLLETPEANLSRAMQWLGVSYSQWFNRRHRRVGHLFQGRFQAVVVEDNAGWQEVARYVHLNPVRVGALKLGKGQRAVSRAGLAAPPSPELVGKRLRLCRLWRGAGLGLPGAVGAALRRAEGRGTPPGAPEIYGAGGAAGCGGTALGPVGGGVGAGDGGLRAKFAALGGRQSPGAESTPAVGPTGELGPDHRRGGAGQKGALA